MLKNPLIKTLLILNFLVFVYLCVVNIRSAIRSRQQQTIRRMSAAQYVDAADRETDRRGEFAYADSKRLWAIGRDGSQITNADLEWILSLMDKTFPNGSRYGVDQWFAVDMRMLFYKGGFTPEQKDIIFKTCSQHLSDQVANKGPNPYVIETCCGFFEQTKDERAVPYLMPLLQMANGRVKVVAARALTELGHPTKVNISSGGFGKPINQ